MKQITFQLETLTPMFMSGENQDRFELRPPSFKGLLRFWWRAYYWGSYNISDEKKETPEDIETKMAEQEGKIFGIASENGRKSGFSIRMKEQNLRRSTKKFSGQHGFLLNYLSYGTEKKNNRREKREYLLPGSTFDITFTMPNKDRMEEVMKSMYLLSTFGAIGAKSRNGFGNFAIHKILENSKESPNLFQQFLFPDKRFLNTLTVNKMLPNFSAFSRGMKVFKLKQTQKTPELCHVALGQIYKDCKGQLDPPKSLSCKKRQYIASPITIQKKVRGDWQTFDESFLERRAKPYFLRVVKVPDQKTPYEGYIIYLPAAYCHGQDTDRQNAPLPDDVDEKFQEYCQIFNQALRTHMEPYYPDS